MRRLLTACILCSLLACGQPGQQNPVPVAKAKAMTPSPSPTQAAAPPAEPAPSPEAPQQSFEEVAMEKVLERQGRFLTTAEKAELMTEWAQKAAPEVQGSWSTKAIEKSEDLKVVYTMTAGGKNVYAVWKVSSQDQSVTANNDLAKQLDEARANLERETLVAMVGNTWNPAPPVYVARRAPNPAPPSPPPAAAPAPSGRKLQLQGIMESDGTKAILSNGKDHYTVAVGETVDGYRVQSIGNGEVVLAGRGGTKRVKMGVKTRKPAPALAPPQPKTAPAPAAPSSTTVIKAVPDEAPEPEIQSEEPTLPGGWRRFNTRDE